MVLIGRLFGVLVDGVMMLVRIRFCCVFGWLTRYICVLVGGVILVSSLVGILLLVF